MPPKRKSKLAKRANEKTSSSSSSRALANLKQIRRFSDFVSKPRVLFWLIVAIALINVFLITYSYWRVRACVVMRSRGIYVA
jgi:hypothetical protein